jgi:hypothetical protein
MMPRSTSLNVLEAGETQSFDLQRAVALLPRQADLDPVEGSSESVLFT